MTAHKTRKREEAEARNARTPVERTRIYREGLPSSRAAAERAIEAAKRPGKWGATPKTSRRPRDPRSDGGAAP